MRFSYTLLEEIWGHYNILLCKNMFGKFKMVYKHDFTFFGLPPDREAMPPQTHICSTQVNDFFALMTSQRCISLEFHFAFFRWLNYVRVCLVASMDVVKSLCHDRSPVIIKESGGRDFVLVVASVAQLVLDSYYRTVRGFQTLVQKMWVMGGHQFLQRCGHIRKTPQENEKEDQGESPIFLLFIDCVYQLTQQFPSEFEFSETYLLGLLDTMHACMFDTFLFDCEKQRRELCKMELGGKPMASLWEFVGEHLVDPKNSAPYVNPLFEYRNVLRGEGKANGTSAESYLQVNTMAPGIRFWSGCYLRWLPPVHVSTGMGENSALHLQQMILVNELKVLRHRLAYCKYEQNPDGNLFAGNQTEEFDSVDFDLGTDFNLDLETSRLLTPSLPFFGDLTLSKLYSEDASREDSFEVSHF